ncbi:MULTISPECIES: TetR/AcrR family transcriptional regulator [Rhodococcus]|uniref:Probable transcriptional regulator, TetR family protein n=1 Tax=Rhodococcus jostii (strain RHA1) TaxID=101510 RepID=Q0S8P2_RHOJR|nr:MULTISPECIES: TetR/AcrR family transcriptional regulator [Rhodococcus]ABG96094.1 probable transcriptional regulator, TetR family protein [Rhodococcus jostii RHA1]EJI97235.1 transcriptional regulator, TetR family [Rhodococcus sp. JVH1]
MLGVTPDTEVVKPTRTQAERTAAMRTKLLDAAVDSLVELGYARTTTQGIARRAGVSRGAQLHHFPTKESLVVAAVEHLVDKRMEEILAADVDAGRGVDVLADAFSGPLFYAALELWVAARTDPALYEATVPLERKVNDALRRGSAEVFGDRFDADTIELSIELVRGLAVSALFRTPEAEQSLRARLLPVWESKVEKS